MRIRAWLWGLAAVATLLVADPACASGWPNAMPAQPLVQASRICAPNIVELRRRCRVLDFSTLGQTKDGRKWYYAFFTTHWADRHGKMDRGFPVIYYLEGAATLRLSLWLNDEPGLAGHWALIAPTRPLLIERGKGDYLGFTLKTSRDLDDQRLFWRSSKKKWREVNVLHRSDADQGRLDAATPPGCEAADDGYFDWARFTFVQALRHGLTHAPCGFLVADLSVAETVLTMTAVSHHNPSPRPSKASAGSQGNRFRLMALFVRRGPEDNRC